MKGFKNSLLILLFQFYFGICVGQTSLADSIFHPDSLKRIVEVLASDSLKGRLTGTEENLKSALFIADEFKKAGLFPVAGLNGFFQQIKPTWFNVIGAIPGKSKPEELIFFSAHYDHIGTTKTNPTLLFSAGNAHVEEGDEIFNGANDNASGVAAVISLAKFFKKMDINERTLIFIAFTGEELGLLGSKHLAGMIDVDSVIAIINIEMIGRAESKHSRPYITGYQNSNLDQILNKNYKLFGERSEKDFFSRDPYKGSLLFERSDNFPFAEKGIPAHSIMATSPFDKYYHNLNDETTTLDFVFMKKIIYAIAIGATGMIKGIDTPIRIK